MQTSSSSLLSTENRGDVSDLSSDRMHLPNEQIENPTVAESKDMVNTPATKKSVAPGKQATEHALKAWKQRGFNRCDLKRCLLNFKSSEVLFEYTSVQRIYL